MSSSKINLEALFPRCRALLGPDSWQKTILGHNPDCVPDHLAEIIKTRRGRRRLPGFLPDLARLEWHLSQVREKRISIPDEPDDFAINPTLRMLEMQWKNLASDSCAPSGQAPIRGHEYILIWKHPQTGDVCTKAASDEDLLVLKMISEKIDRQVVAKIGAIPTFAIDAAVDRAVSLGIVVAPNSLLRRDFVISKASPFNGEQFFVSPSFTLQWHITQACDLTCKHCYDRSDRSAMTREQALMIIDDLDAFCRQRHVKGQISFTGGNPLLHPDFLFLYGAAADRGFHLMVLGNPTPRERFRDLVSIRQPDFFQVSLDGLPEYNDFIRGKGHFEKTLSFLDTLRELGVYSMVMLTLTNDNIQQVLTLAKLLNGKADVFYFNRLSKVGQGATLDLPSRQEYVSFLEQYLDASKSNPILGLKDNLFNILHYRTGVEPFGGCTGFGCGAAFNFVAVLADGEVHACRKFPSPIGNILHQGLAEIYDSEQARRYRAGCAECRSCPVRAVCGGCLASSFSFGRNVFEKKDPYCFFDTVAQKGTAAF
jgi:selenobiotic family peptide radical SAM maturase